MAAITDKAARKAVSAGSGNCKEGSSFVGKVVGIARDNVSCTGISERGCFERRVCVLRGDAHAGKACERLVIFYIKKLQIRSVRGIEGIINIGNLCGLPVLRDRNRGISRNMVCSQKPAVSKMHCRTVVYRNNTC